MNKGHGMLFDTLQHSKRAKEVGCSVAHAEFQVEALAEVINAKLVSNSALDRTFKELEYRLTIKVGTMLVVAVSVLAAIIKF